MFKEDKVTQASAIFLEKSGGKMKFIKLIKLIYLTDRAAYAERGKSVSEDEYYSMFHGPVPSNTYNLIQYASDRLIEGSAWINDIKNFGQVWEDYIKDAEDHQVELQNHPKFEALSDYELELLERIYKEFGEYEAWDLVDHLHEVLPEWDEVERNSRKDLPIEQILQRGLKKPKSESDKITRENEIHQKADELFA